MSTRTLAIGMIATPRPGIEVRDAIDQLRRGGFGELVHLFCEPGMPPLPPLARVILHRNPTRRGMVGNWRYCLEWLVEHTTAEVLMVCEDDVTYCRGARAAWDAVTDAGGQVGFWSLYTPARDRPLVGGKPGWSVANRGRDAWGTQAMCFPRSSAEVLLENEPLRTEDQLRGPTDAIVANCFLQRGVPCFYHNPSLANHIGRVSSVGNNWYDEHVGLDFDPEFEVRSAEFGVRNGQEIKVRNSECGIRNGPDAQIATPNSALRIANCTARRTPHSAVVTVFQPNIPLEVVSAQAEVICRFLPPGCEFVPVEVGHHALGLDDALRELHHEAYVIFDIDCIPLAAWVIPWLLENARAGVVVGPAQRANHLSNGKHLYAGPSALAFSRATYERLGRPSFRATERGDVAEELTYACEAADIPVILLWPTHVAEPKWQLRSGLTFGRGTTFGGAVFHAFEISKGETTAMFLRKCSEVLSRAAREADPGLRSPEAGASSPRGGAAIFHEQWYAEDELDRLAEAVRSTAEAEGLIVEIGCWEGRSTAAIANACFPERLLAVDTWQGCPTEAPDHESVRIARERDVFAVFQANMEALTRGNVEPLQDDALDFLRRTREPIKFCHVDGPHDYPSVLATLQLLLPRLVGGAVLFGHDYQTAHARRDDLQGGVERAVRELLPQHVAKGNTWSYRHSSRKS